MAEDVNARHAICERAREHRRRYDRKIKEYGAEKLRLGPEVDQLKAQIRSLNGELGSIVDILPRIAKRPTVGTVVVEGSIEIAKQIQRARIKGEIRELEARLAPLERRQEEVARLLEEARYNFDQTARNFERHNCREFGTF